ncbi:hypothetical protein E4T52_09151 [Aureobasidium sp. EXF-3400]|nr:hypothetical protein E4T51_08278 [Aureobasidium sp. EXF-12344]KAI4775899.1 hypothetical protein E4T52_09151 [Aureobasidium sp. EXF-3400]
MKLFAVLAFVLAALFGTALVCANNATLSTTTATVTKTVFHTVTTSVNIATLPAFDSSAAVSDSAPSVELKSVYVQTIELTSTILTTEVDGVVVTSTATAVLTAVSTDFEEVTSTSTKHIGTTITTTSVVVSATTPLVTTTSSQISTEQQIAQMWGLNGGERLVTGNWLTFSLVLLSFTHYLLFAHY